jgi:SAM-dependent methyltransferase
VWKSLSPDEKKIVFGACREFNNSFYAKPEEYDRVHKRTLAPRETREGQLVQYALDKYKPRTVLEVGPGNGYYTRIFLEHYTVKEYSAIDIVNAFLEYIRNHVVREDELNRVDLINADLLAHQFKKRFDLIVFINALHHIPNRLEIVRKCQTLLNENGKIVLIEPLHSLPRIIQLIKKFFIYYYKKSYWQNRNNLSNHHFLTKMEVRFIARKCSLRINHAFCYLFRGERHLARFKRKNLNFFLTSFHMPMSLFARIVYLVLEKKTRP